ncbi:uncharacterized protein Tco025E_07009 [Trypanosoma conorhini]|uniref:Uncharacterized protein n=1 Tax=Trypanosoma conorhini TaxID=83891 RepID=A0A3R7MPY5_9TRYP|nr:uncharacterized protein Tco025E_07009 [Trypanosoma conorhini]RNF09384.1 hypothetical protein Tco025E_07009 [Trypanosoma conorhini]
MPAPVTRHWTALSLLVRQAYRSFVFYDAKTASDVIAALGDLHEPPLSLHALVLCVLTTLPNFSSGDHVARLFQGLSLLRVRHTMLTAHFLKHYLRCCFVNGCMATPRVAVPVGMEYSVIDPLRFLSSFAVILHTLERFHPTEIVNALFDSLEEMLGADFGPSLFFHYRYSHKSCEPDEANIEPSSENAEEVAEEIFFVLQRFLIIYRRHPYGSRYKRTGKLLAFYADHLHFHHLVCLLCLMEEADTKCHKWTAHFSKEQELSDLQRQLLCYLVYRFRPEALRPGVLSKVEIVALLRHVNYYNLSGLPPDVRSGIYSIADALCFILEKAPLTLNATRFLVVNDLLSQDEEPQHMEKEISTEAWQLRQKPRLKHFLDGLQQLILDRGSRFVCKEDLWLYTEVLLILCYRLLLSHAADEKSVATPQLLRTCQLTCDALGRLERHGESGNASVEFRILLSSQPVRLLLQQRASLLGSGLVLALSEVITRYGIQTALRLAMRHAANDMDLQCLCFLLQERHPTVELLARIDSAITMICGQKCSTQYTVKHIAEALSMLGSRNWVTLCGGNERWITLATSVRLSVAVNSLVFYIRKTEQDATRQQALAQLLKLLTVLSPVELHSDSDKRCRCLTARIPGSNAVKLLIESVLRVCIDCTPKFAFFRDHGDDCSFPALNTSDFAERCFLRSRSSKLWKAAEAFSDDVWFSEDAAHCEKDMYSFHSKQQSTRNVVEFALWMGAFRFAAERKGGNERELFLSSMRMEELRRMHTEILRSASYLVLRDNSWRCSTLRQRLLRAFYIELKCEGLHLIGRNEPIFIRHEIFKHVIPLLIAELYRLVLTPCFDEDLTLTSVETCISGDAWMLLEHGDVDAAELVVLFESSMDEFRTNGVDKSPLLLLHDIVWSSLTCIASLSTALKEWIDGFRYGSSFNTENVFDGEICHKLRKDSGTVLVANARNTLLWTLLLLACFMRCQAAVLKSEEAAQLTAAQTAVARLVRLVSQLSPVLRRPRPAPECLLALKLREVLEGLRDGAVGGSNDCVAGVLDDVLRREQPHFSRWEGTFESVAAQMRRYV